MSALIASSISPFLQRGKVTSNKLWGRMSEGYFLCVISLGWDMENDFTAHLSQLIKHQKHEADHGIFDWFDAQVPLPGWSGYGRFQTVVVECAQFGGRIPSVQQTLDMEMVNVLGKKERNMTSCHYLLTLIRFGSAAYVFSRGWRSRFTLTGFAHTTKIVPA